MSVALRVFVKYFDHVVVPATLPFVLINYVKDLRFRNDLTLRNILLDGKRPSLHDVDVMDFTHIYYTESDQILYIKDINILNILLANNNGTTLLVGRRREKKADTSPYEYMKHLVPTRATCGLSGYVIDTSVNYFIRSIN